MKQIRKISNLVAEELVNAGLNENSDTFEGKVSEIVDMISEAVKDADRKDAGDTEILEEADEDEIYVATEDTDLDGHEVLEGEFVGVDDIDEEAETAVIDIYTEDGDIKEEDVTVNLGALDEFADNSEIVEVDYDDIEESIHIHNGKKFKRSAKLDKLKEKSKGKNFFFKKVGDKIVKIKKSAKAKKAWAKNALHNFKGAARKKAQKSLAKRRKLVKDGFDLDINGMTFAVEEGDEIVSEGDKISIIRDGKAILSNVTVKENFIEECASSGVIEDEDEEDKKKEVKECDSSKKSVEEDDDEDKEEEKTDEGALLTYRSKDGYVLVKEGEEYVMRNRVIARARLISEGYDVTAKQLDDAVNGKTVVL